MPGADMPRIPPTRRLLHLHPLTISSLPAHPDLRYKPPSNNAPDPRPKLADFLSTALSEAVELITFTIPHTLQKEAKLRTPRGSNSMVKVSSGFLPAREVTMPQTGSGKLRKKSLPGNVAGAWSGAAAGDEEQDMNQGPEYWVCRNSEHEDIPSEGTACWNEFYDGLCKDHTEHEMQYTPSLVDADRLLEWHCVDVQLQEDWDVVNCAIYGITHCPPPTYLIKPRTFYILLITAAAPLPNYADSSPLSRISSFGSATSNTSYNSVSTFSSTSGASHSKRTEFFTIQIPVSLPKSMHTHHRTDSILGRYLSVEHVRLVSPLPPLPPSTSTPLSSPSSSPPSKTPNQPSLTPESVGTIEWTMATSSDARGWIPQYLARLEMPRTITADVGLFLDWVHGKREHPKNGCVLTTRECGAEEEKNEWKAGSSKRKRRRRNLKVGLLN
ncbi:hypothetical protein AJ80_00380 [Polytolypa hystricis UAMH7299]|uniref:DUF3074 domain-containing protein n=1 Tax=Polytolypa hystricis (strain UAMH7299) TaxID=1447883 RepID=A0A2B7Z350_POLH7|nr:hypothetical protein AJ80_00380 [Polytolypa hystricis UAMH7299]